MAVSDAYYDAAGNRRGSAANATFTVAREARAAVAVSLSATPSPVAEGSPVTVTATLAEALEEAVTVPLTTTRGTSEEGDHGSLSSIALRAGFTSATGTITTSEDTDGDDETFTVALGTLPSGLTAGTASSVEVTITDSGQQRAVPLALSALTGSTSTDGSTFGGTLNLGTFAAETTTYTATVAHAVTHVRLTPTASAAGTTVQVGKGVEPRGGDERVDKRCDRTRRGRQRARGESERRRREGQDLHGDGEPRGASPLFGRGSVRTVGGSRRSRELVGVGDRDVREGDDGLCGEGALRDDHTPG